MQPTVFKNFQVPVFPNYATLVKAGDVPLRVLLSPDGGPVTFAFTVQDITGTSNATFRLNALGVIVLAPKQALYATALAGGIGISSAASEALPLAPKPRW